MIGGLLKSASSLAILAAAGLLVGGITMAPKAARAADLGGDCCADLEERVAQLEATTVRKGNKKVSLTISGRLAASITYFSDNSSPAANAPDGSGPLTTDSKSDLYFGEQTGNGPALFFNGEGKISSDLVAGFHMELDYNLMGSNSQNTRQAGNTASSGDTFVYLNSKSLGKLQLGHMNSALDDWDNVGFAGGYIDGTLNIRSVGAFFLRDSTGASSGITYAGMISGLDSSGDNGIKYISPTLGNWLTLETGASGDDTFYVGAKLSGNITKTVAVKAAVAYQTARDGDGAAGGAQAFINQNGTANLLNVAGGIEDSASGLFVQGTYGVAYANGNAATTNLGTGTVLTHTQDITTWTAFLGWHKNVSGMGNTEIFGQYLKSDNVFADNTSAHVWQVGIDQAIDAASSHLFVTYENYNADSLPAGLNNGTSTVGTQDLSTLTAGMGITF